MSLTVSLPLYACYHFKPSDATSYSMYCNGYVSQSISVASIYHLSETIYRIRELFPCYVLSFILLQTQVTKKVRFMMLSGELY